MHASTSMRPAQATGARGVRCTPVHSARPARRGAAVIVRVRDKAGEGSGGRNSAAAPDPAPPLRPRLSRQPPSPRPPFLCLRQAQIDPAAALAVTQQAVAYGVFIAGEGYLTRGNLAEGTPGRPGVAATAGGAVAAVAAAILVNAGGPAAGAGLALGAAASLASGATYVKRALDVPGDRLAWPGPKAWPGAMALVSFLAVSVFAQALAGA